jgi:hypothetical protein
MIAGSRIQSRGQVGRIREVEMVAASLVGQQAVAVAPTKGAGVRKEAGARKNPLPQSHRVHLRDSRLRDPHLLSLILAYQNRSVLARAS